MFLARQKLRLEQLSLVPRINMKKLLLVAVLLCSGCYTRQSLQAADAEMLSDTLYYYQDTRTGVCYSGAYLRIDGAIWSSVPCTNEIVKTSTKFKSKP